MFGYACTETEGLMPLPIYLSHRLVEKQAELRKNGKLKWLRPDAKSQVTVKYVDGKPSEIDTIVLSTQHHPDVEHKHIEQSVIEEIIKPVLAGQTLAKNIKYLVNPTGRFVIGGPQGDCGLTGRKIIVDTYGGAAPHGGGAFSGKDPTKVDRSAAYISRYLAKNIVAAGLAKRCTIQLAYAIGVSHPLSLYVDTHGTGTVEDGAIEETIKGIGKLGGLTPRGIREHLALNKPIYRKSAAYGHFGRKAQGDFFPWEKTDLVDDLKAALG
jgi:S-adenosylmethionine synthetase